jgi:PDZ domain
MTDFLNQLVRRSETEAVAREKKHQQELREREEAEAAAEAKRQQELRERKAAEAAAAEAKRQQELRQREEAEAGAEAKRQELRQREEAEAVAAEAKRQQELRQRKAAEAAAAEAKRQQELRQREEAEAAAAAEARRQQLRARQRLIYFATVVLLCLTSVGAFLYWGTLGPRDNSLSGPPLSSVEDKAKPSVPPRHEPATAATSKPANAQVGPSAATGPHPSLEAPPGGTAPQQPTSNDGLDARTPPPNATPLVAPPPAVPSALAEAPALGLPEAKQSDPVPTERTSPSTFLAPPQQAAEQPQLAPNAAVAKPSPKTSPPHAPFGRMATNDPGARKPDASETKLKTAAIENNVDSAMRRLRQDRPGRTEPPSPPLQELSVPLPAYPVTSSSAVGLLCQSVTKETAGGLGLEAPQGMVVTGVVVGSPADRAGLREDDVILKIGGTEAHQLSVLTKVAADMPPGQTVALDVYRQGHRRVVQLAVDDLHQ